MSTQTSVQTIQNEIIPNCGALLLAMVFSAMLYGITILQTYIYYNRCCHDNIYVTALVTVLLLLDTAHMTSIIESVWFYVIANFGDLNTLGTIAPGISAEVITTITIGLIVQHFFAMRVWLTNGRRALAPIFIVALSFAQFALGIYYAVRQAGEASSLPHIAWVAGVGPGCGVVADFMITVTLCYNLSKYRSGTPRSDRLVNILMMYTVNTGLLTSLVATCAIILANVLSTTLWSLIPFCLLSKCYVNSVLAVLNARKKLRDPSYHSQPARHASKSDKRSPAQLDLTEVRLTDVVISDEDPNNRTTREFCAVGVGSVDPEGGVS